MAKKRELLGIRITGAYTQRSIVFDDSGIPWIVDPAKGTVSPAIVQMPAAEKRK